MSAHVLPKAPVVSREEEDDKTTIESGWEEEASTTVEQGDVADKIRAIGAGIEQARRPNTNITSTNAGSMPDEPTVDDQRGAAALARLPPPAVARLVITQGNDSGQSIEVRPGKTYTIGRGVDNDLVLTDIAVSRKHFDVRHERGSWVLADRGSGNGTLVNHRIEDAPFLLTSGDVIEIGNTAFRFDLPNGVPRTQSSFEVSIDDDLELSTVAGKPLHEDVPAMPHQRVAPARAPIMAPGMAMPPVSAPAPLASGSPAVTQSRPKTLPPPALPAPRPRPRTQSSRPPAGYALDRPGPPSQPQPLPPSSLTAALAPTMSPMHGMQALQPPQPQATLPLLPMANRAPLPPAALIDPPLGAMPATIPGQGPPRPAGHPGRQPFGYPSASELPQPHAPSGARGMMIVASAQAGRDASSTALVQPMSYANGQPVMAPQSTYRAAPPLSRRMKLVLGGAGLAVFAAITTIAVVKGSTGGATSGTTGGPGPADTSGATLSRPVPAPNPTVVPIHDPRAVKSMAPPGTDKTPTNSPAPVPPQADPRTDPSAETLAATPPPPAPTPPTTENPPTPKPSQVEIATSRTDRTSKVEVAAPATNKTDKRAATRTDKRTDKKTTPKADVARAELDRTSKVEVARADKKRGGRSTQDVKNEADGLYRAKRFSDAAALVTAALSSFSGGDSQELKNIAAIYAQLGKAYNVGMAPGTKPTDAFVALRRAISYDRSVGSAYVAEIEGVIVTVAAKAALSYAAAKEYEAAFQAVRFAESLGSTSPTNRAVRDKLEELAGELYRSAASELSTDPDSARKKLRQILGMVDTKSPLYGKASKLLNGS